MKLPSGILVAALASAVGLSSANAADMYSAPAARYVGGPVYGGNWTGFYLGGHVGGVWDTNEIKDLNGNWCSPALTGIGCSYNNDTSAVFGGGQIGYNYQTGSFVIGPEVDLGYMDLSHTHVAPGFTLSDSWSSIAGGFYATATGRLGYSFDRALVYAKGGYAYYDGKVGTFSSNISATLDARGLSGWTVGGGAEYKFNPSWSLKVEYLHFDFGSSSYTFPVSNYCGPLRDQQCPYKNSLTADSVKVGVNYFVNTAYMPPEIAPGS